MLRVSVIIPTLNEQESVCAAIESAIAVGADEVIVVDGGSTDCTVEAARRLASVLQSEPGRAIQQNAGAAKSIGDVLLFLHADCRLTENAISAIRESMATSGDLVAGCFRQQIDQTGMKYRLVAAGNDLRVRMLKWAYGDQGIFVRADVFRSLGGFPATRFLEDLLLMKQLKRMGKIHLLNETIIVSARRWKRRGVWTQTLRNWGIILAAHAGVSPDRLAKFYPNER